MAQRKFKCRCLCYWWFLLLNRQSNFQKAVISSSEAYLVQFVARRWNCGQRLLTFRRRISSSPQQIGIENRNICCFAKASCYYELSPTSPSIKQENHRWVSLQRDLLKILFHIHWMLQSAKVCNTKLQGVLRYWAYVNPSNLASWSEVDVVSSKRAWSR